MEEKETFKCEFPKCNCLNYISKEGRSDYTQDYKEGKIKAWPHCQCGHVAEEHN